MHASNDSSHFRFSPELTGFFRANLPVEIVIVLSLAVGLLMVLVFRYTSDQKAIRIAKNQLKAHLLAVRLFQDQLPVVLKSYVRIIGATGRYLRLAFKPLLFVIIPLILLIVQLNRYLGFTPLHTGQAFLVKATSDTAESLDQISLQLPPEIEMTAPPVHVRSENEIVWRVVAQKYGRYDLVVENAGQSLDKEVVVSSEVVRVSPVRLRGRLWERFFVSAESALPANSPVRSIAVNYPSRTIDFAFLEWNWMWLFFVWSLFAAFLFKTILRIEI